MPEKIWREELVELLSAGDVQLVEVLPEQEFRELHLPDAVNIPLKDLDESTVSSLEKSQTVVVY